MNKGVNRIWPIHTKEYYSAVKRGEVLIHATTQMNAENTPRERSQTPKTTYCVIPFI